MKIVIRTLRPTRISPYVAVEPELDHKLLRYDNMI